MCQGREWHGKLKPGGRVLAVVPDLDGSQDRRARPCTCQSLLEEYGEGISTPQHRHLEAHDQLRRNDFDVGKLVAKNFSIHLHYYNPGSMKHILGKVVEQFGFSKYDIISADNHKDFHFILEKQQRSPPSAPGGSSFNVTSAVGRVWRDAPHLGQNRAENLALKPWSREVAPMSPW